MKIDGNQIWEDTTPDKSLGKRYRCRLCGVELNSTDVVWYRRGLEHGKGSSNAKRP